jgi:hypothetical protein
MILKNGVVLMSPEIKDQVRVLLQSVKLREIVPLRLVSERLGPLPQPGGEMKVEWTQTFANDDPVIPEGTIRIFRPRYEFFAVQSEKVLYKQESTFMIVFEIVDSTIFESVWKMEEVKKIFLERQIQHTVWPIFRQQVQDGMSRLGMQPVTLPWLL